MDNIYLLKKIQEKLSLLKNLFLTQMSKDINNNKKILFTLIELNFSKTVKNKENLKMTLDTVENMYQFYNKIDIMLGDLHELIYSHEDQFGYNNVEIKPFKIEEENFKDIYYKAEALHNETVDSLNFFIKISSNKNRLKKILQLIKPENLNIN